MNIFGTYDEEKALNSLNLETKNSNLDGIYRPKLQDAANPAKGYTATIRFLTNIFKNEEGTVEVGEPFYKVSKTYVNIQSKPDLSGYYPSNANFNEKDPLATMYFALDKSDDYVLKSRAKCLNRDVKYYAYIQVIEDENNPSLVGKILVYPFTKGIYDKIVEEKEGSLSGEKCNIFDLQNGKDFVLKIREKETKSDDGRVLKFPNYDSSGFKHNRTPIHVLNKEGQFKVLPSTKNEFGHNIVDAKYSSLGLEYLLSRDCSLEKHKPVPYTNEELAKVKQIEAYLFGLENKTATEPKEFAKNPLDSEDEKMFQVGANVGGLDDDLPF